MPQRERPLGRLASVAARGPSVGRLDQDRADVDAAVGDHAAWLHSSRPGVEALHHLRRDALLVAVAALPLRLGAEPQRRQDLDARPVVAAPLQHRDEAGEQLAVVLVVAGPRHGDDRQEAVIATSCRRPRMARSKVPSPRTGSFVAAS